MNRAAAAVIVAALAGLFGAPAVAASYAPVPSQVVSGKTLAGMADRVAHSLVTDPDREVVPAFTMVDQRLPVGELSIALEQPQMNPTYVSIPIALNVDGKTARTVFAGYRIVSYIHTAVAAHDVNMGMVLKSEDITIARIASNGRPVVDPAALVGRRLNQNLSRGMPLYVEQTRVNELVHAGQPCVFVIHDGPVRLAADVIARTGGGLGDLVAVFNPATNRALSGVVTGPGKVEFTLPGGEEETQ